MAARVFLRMTGNYDHIQTEITASLFSQEAKQLSMLAALRGTDDKDNEDDAEPPASPTANVFDETGELLTSERLAAWSLLAGRIEPPPNLFTTPSRTVVAAVLDRFESTAVVLTDIPLPGGALVNEPWRNELADFLNTLTQQIKAVSNKDLPPILPVDSPAGFLRIIHLPGLSPGSFLDQFLPNHLKKNQIEEKKEDSSTVVTAVLT